MYVTTVKIVLNFTSLKVNISNNMHFPKKFKNYCNHCITKHIVVHDFSKKLQMIFCVKIKRKHNYIRNIEWSKII